MSSHINDQIWDAMVDKINEDGLDEAVFCEFHIDDCIEYLKTGRVPDSYDRILYRLYKM